MTSENPTNSGASTDLPASKNVALDSGTSWEKIAGFSRAVKVDNNVYISGTTATNKEGQVVGENDPAKQMEYIIKIVAEVLAQLGGSLEDVVRTTVYVQNLADWEAAARAHGKAFGQIRPANTLVQAELVGDEYLVEMQTDAIIGSGNRRKQQMVRDDV